MEEVIEERKRKDQAHNEEIDELISKYRSIRNTLLLTLFLLVPLILLPAAYCIYSKGFSRSFEHKLLIAIWKQDWVCTLVRSSFTLALTIASWSLSKTISIILPLGYLRLKKHLNGRQMRFYSALLKIHLYVARSIFLLLMLFVLANMVYDTTIMHHVWETLSKRISEGKATADNSETRPLGESVIYYLERIHICALLFAYILSLFKYLVALVRYSFHKETFGPRMTISERKIKLLEEVYKSVNSGAFAKDQLNLSSEHRAGMVAKAIFSSAIAQTEKSSSPDETVSKADFLTIWGAEKGEAYFTFLKGSNSDDNNLSLAETQKCVIDIYHEQRNINKSLKSNKHIIHKLDSMLSTIGLILAALLCTPFLDLGVTTLWAGFLALFTALGFALQSVGKTSFEAMLFIFVVHSFDIGDEVVIDGERFYVEYLEIFTSEFRQVKDGAIVYAPNSSLSSKNITNISRTQRELQLL